MYFRNIWQGKNKITSIQKIYATPGLSRKGGGCMQYHGRCSALRKVPEPFFLESDFLLKSATLFVHDHDALLRVIMVIFSLQEGVLFAFQPFWTRL